MSANTVWAIASLVTLAIPLAFWLRSTWNSRAQTLRTLRAAASCAMWFLAFFAACGLAYLFFASLALPVKSVTTKEQ